MNSHELARLLLGLPERDLTITNDGGTVTGAIDNKMRTEYGPDLPCIVLEVDLR